MDGSVVMYHDENDGVRSPDDIQARRLKNRERQRRYRARKRQEADTRKATSVTQSTPLLHYQQAPTQLVSVPVEVDMSVKDCLTRVHCLRDWKKDARTAHVQKYQETSPAETSLTSVEPADVQSSHSSIPTIDNTVTLSRRHWKAEARNKRSLE